VIAGFFVSTLLRFFCIKSTLFVILSRHFHDNDHDMATIRKRGAAWQAQVFLHGVRKSGTFGTKIEAQQWAAQIEGQILAGKTDEIPDKTFADLLRRYAKEVSPTKRGERWERIRIELTCRDDVVNVHLRELDSRAIAAWRDRRLAQVSPASVRREWNLLSSACTIAVKEWKWLKENPMSEVKRPPPTEARDRMATQDEIDRLLFVLGYHTEKQPATISARVGAACLFAIETAMRAGEIAGLTWENVFLDRKFCKTAGKTAAAKRDVPLSPEAIRIIKQMPTTGDTVFNVSTAQIDALFRKAKGNALVTELHFHDFRHLAITRLAQKLDVLDLARMVGHRDLKMLMIYYNKSAEDMAGRL
jgi:integrase